MPEVTPKDIQQLRHGAAVGMMDAKKALIDADGDMEKAFELLRERGQAKMAKRSDREASEGSIGHYIHIQNDRPVLGVLVALACETDFVAKSDEFKETADDIAMHVSWAAPRWISRDEVDQNEADKEKELIARQAESEGKPAEMLDRIVEGKLEAWYGDNVLLEQQFINTEKFDGTVGDMVAALAAKMGENISVRDVARVTVGS